MYEIEITEVTTEMIGEITWDQMVDYAANICGNGILLFKEEIIFTDGTKDDEFGFAAELSDNLFLVYSYNSTNGITHVEIKHKDKIWYPVPKWVIKRGRIPKNQFVDAKGVRRYKYQGV